MPSGLPTFPCWRLPLAGVRAAGSGTTGYSLNMSPEPFLLGLWSCHK